MNVVSVENYVKASKQIEKSKTKILDTLAQLHEDLCQLAALERDLESERLKGVKHERGLAHNAPELVEHLDNHNKQLQLPVLKVWGYVNDAMTAIYQYNKSAMSGSIDRLPQVFKSDRFQEFTKGKE